MEDSLNLTQDELDILLDECQEEKRKISRKLTMNMLERDQLRIKFKQWESDEKFLLAIKHGPEFVEPLAGVDRNTLNTLRERSKKLYEKYDKIIQN